MGSDVTKARGMDELDRLVLAAYSNANKKTMLNYRQAVEKYGFNYVKRGLVQRIDERKRESQERNERLYREEQEKSARIAAAKERKAVANAERKAAKPSKPFYLRPDMAPVPNCIIRSSLFGIVRSGRRRRVEDWKVLRKYGKEGWTIRWKGVQLDQADADLWLLLVRKAAVANDDFLEGRTLEEKAIAIEFTRGKLLRELKRAKGKSNKKWLDKAIDRLRDCDIQVEDPTGKCRYSGKLLLDRYEDDGADMEVIEVNAKLANLLGRDFSLINFNKRLELGRDQLAKWLHGFLCSHKAGRVYPISLLKLQGLSKTTTEIHKFRERVIEALKKLTDVVEVFCVENRGCNTVIKIKLTPKNGR